MLKRKFPHILIIAALTIAFSLAGITKTSFANSQIDSGMYFVDPDDRQGEFYNFSVWSTLSPVKQTNLILKYPHENIIIYLGNLDKVATLEATLKTGDFMTASKDYIPGDITGEFKDFETGEIFSVLEDKEFKVIDIR